MYGMVYCLATGEVRDNWASMHLPGQRSKAKRYLSDQAMNKQMPEYCDYRDAKILISSWNIDANKPEKFDQRDEQKIREWLTSMRDPDIIAVGIQEIVDLESKKQTASKNG